MKRTALAGFGIFAGALGAFRTTAEAQGGWLVDQDSIQQGMYGGSARSVREIPNGYLLFCHQVSTYGTNRTHVFTRILDGDGAMVTELEFGTDTIQQNLGYIGGIL